MAGGSLAGRLQFLRGLGLKDPTIKPPRDRVIDRFGDFRQAPRGGIQPSVAPLRGDRQFADAFTDDSPFGGYQFDIDDNEFEHFADQGGFTDELMEEAAAKAFAIGRRGGNIRAVRDEVLFSRDLQEILGPKDRDLFEQAVIDAFMQGREASGTSVRGGHLDRRPFMNQRGIPRAFGDAKFGTEDR